jgi:predicted aldo/keto reductase-like oxidoreductase
LESSLKRLHTDHVDLYQMHALTTLDEVKQALGPGGAAEAFVRARDEGLVRFLGFSAHSVEGALEAMRQFSFDTVMFPFNFVTYYEESFGPEVLDEAERQGMGRLALKAMARSPWPAGANRVYPKCWYEPISDPEMAGLALRFTLSMAVTAAVAPGHVELLRMAMDIAENFTPLTDNEKERLKAAAHSLSPIFHRNPGPDA